MRKWLQRKILDLIKDDINDIARRAYDDGCYITMRQMEAQKKLEFAHLVAHNAKLTEMMNERINLTMPPSFIIPADKQESE